MINKNQRFSRASAETWADIAWACKAGLFDMDHVVPLPIVGNNDVPYIWEVDRFIISKQDM